MTLQLRFSWLSSVLVGLVAACGGDGVVASPMSQPAGEMRAPTDAGVASPETVDVPTARATPEAEPSMAATAQPTMVDAAAADASTITDAAPDPATACDTEACNVVDGTCAASEGGGSTCQARVVDIAVGERVVCMLRRDGRLVCWGRNNPLHIDAVAREPNHDFVQVVAADESVCALRKDGSHRCWGKQLDASASPQPLQLLAAGPGERLCGVAPDGVIACVGADDFGQTTGPTADPGHDVKQLSLGRDHSCGVRASGAIACWGRDDYGQVSGPMNEGASGFTHVSAGLDHTCGLRSDGTLRCWGGKPDFRDPVDLPNRYATKRYRALASGQGQTCAAATDGEVTCWNGAPPADNQGFERLTLGGSTLCAIRTNGSVACWGDDQDGKLAGAEVSQRYKQLSASPTGVCAVSMDGLPSCWASDAYISARELMNVRQIDLSDELNGFCALHDDGTIACALVGPGPAPSENSGYVQAATGSFGCGLRSDATVTCWGNERIEQRDATYTQITAAVGFACGLRNDGSVQCWTDPTSPRAVPVIDPALRFKQIDASALRFCGVLTSGAIACSSIQDAFQAGADASAYPNTDVVQVATSRDQVCAVLMDGTLRCWGAAGSEAASADEHDITQVALAEYRTCVLRNDGSYRCWGDNVVDTRALLMHVDF
jgi:hypothetical protein